VAPPNTASLLDFEEVLKELRKREGKGRASWVSAPPTRGFGTIRSHPEEEEQLMSYGDDGGLSSADEYEPEEEEGSEAEGEGETELPEEAIEGPKFVIDTPTTPTVPPATAMPASLAKAFGRKDSASEATPKAATGPSPKTASGFIPKMKFPRRKAPTTDSSSRSPSASSASSTLSTGTGAGEGSASEANTDSASKDKDKDKDKKKRVFRKRWSTGSSNNSSSSAVMALTPLKTTGDALAQVPANEAQQASASGGESSATSAPFIVSPAQTPVARKGDYMFEAGNDIMGIVMLEIIKAENLPKLKNGEVSSYLSKLLLKRRSNTHWFRYGSFRRHLFRKKSIPNARVATHVEPRLGRKALIPRPSLRNSVSAFVDDLGLGQVVLQRPRRRCQF